MSVAARSPSQCPAGSRTRSPRRAGRFAPRPIEAAQPEPVRGDWAAHRANTWHKLARPGRFVHYIELRKLLIEHGDRLANDIDNSSANYRSNSAN
jgi:hypothetical protein